MLRTYAIARRDMCRIIHQLNSKWGNLRIKISKHLFLLARALLRAYLMLHGGMGYAKGGNMTETATATIRQQKNFNNIRR